MADRSASEERGLLKEAKESESKMRPRRARTIYLGAISHANEYVKQMKRRSDVQAEELGEQKLRADTGLETSGVALPARGCSSQLIDCLCTQPIASQPCCSCQQQHLKRIASLHRLSRTSIKGELPVYSYGDTS